MTLSAVARKSISDLTRRRGRALFTVAALALAVASVSLFALPTLMSRAMNREIAADKLADVTVTVKPLPLTAAQIAALGSLPNVLAFAPRTTFSTRVYVGARRQKAFLIGESSFAHQTVDAVTVTAGSAPGEGAVLTDVQNAAYGRGVGGAGGAVRLFAGNGNVVSLPISGEGRNLTGAQIVAKDGFVTLYATAPDGRRVEWHARLHQACVPPARPVLCCRPSDRDARSAATCRRSPASPASATCPKSAPRATGRARAASTTSRASSTWSRCWPSSARWCCCRAR